MPGTSKVYIIGFMGSGKTTAGKKLASALGWSFADLDETIEQEQKKSIEKIFSESGEDYFRRLEYLALRSFDNALNIVISTGGGAPCNTGNIDFMNKTGIVIYLKMAAVEILKRLEGQQDSRPLVKGRKGEDLKEFIENKMREREPFYNQATITEDGSAVDIQKLAEKIRGIIV
jgi:shikimate kinase